MITGVNRNSSVKELKYKFESVFGIPSFLVELYYLDECPLLDSEPLSYYHILPDAKLKAHVWRYSEKLVTAARCGNLSAVREEIFQTCKSLKEDYDADKALWALFIGCFHGHEEMVDNLLKEGVKYRKCLPSGLDAIQVAATRGNIKCVELLLSMKEEETRYATVTYRSFFSYTSVVCKLLGWEKTFRSAVTITRHSFPE